MSFNRVYFFENQYRLGKNAEAPRTLESLADDAGRPLTRNLARNLLVQLYEDAKNHEQSIKALNKMLAEPTPAFPKQAVLLRWEKSTNRWESPARRAPSTRRSRPERGAEEARLAEERLKALPVKK